MAIEKCQSCKKPFNVVEHKLPMPGTKEKESIICPYCDHLIERMCNGWWVVSALSEQEQKDYFVGNDS